VAAAITATGQARSMAVATTVVVWVAALANAIMRRCQVDINPYRTPTAADFRPSLLPPCARKRDYFACAAPAVRVVTGTLHRVHGGHVKRFVAEPPPGPVRRPARVALMLALAHKISRRLTPGLCAIARR
jgi:hypothetical protein